MGNKIQRIYIGTNQVRPSKTYTYSYDFTTGSVSDLQNNGWTVPNTVTINSNGLQNSSWSSLLNTSMTDLSNAISNARRVKTEIVFLKSGTICDYGMNIRGNSNNDVQGTYGNYTNAQFYIGGDSYLNQNYTISDGTITISSDANFITKKARYIHTGAGLDITYDITDAEIAVVKTGIGIRLGTTFKSGSYVKNISVIIEY